MEKDLSYIVAIDIGTSSIRCHVINSLMETVGTASSKVQLLYPDVGFVEIDPDEFWSTTVQLIKDVIKNANLTSTDIKCIGISAQRSTFINWAKDSGKPLHNFITWNDTRSKKIVKDWNESLIFQAIQKLARVWHIVGTFGRNDQILMASRLKLSTTQCTGRLMWVLQNLPNVKLEGSRENLCFGTIDSWLVYKLTGGAKHVSEITHASSTGLFDPFTMQWSSLLCRLCSIPTHILPEVVSSDYNFGSTEPNLFGASIPIKCVIADQQASMFGECCFEKGNIKITMGTGSFIDVNTGSSPIASHSDTYPLVAWKLGDNATYLSEAACRDTGSLIIWALKVGIADNIDNTSSQARNVKDSDGVFFIPAFSGLPPPLSDDHAASGFLGIKPTSTRDHLMRAILESIVYTIILAYNMLDNNDNYQFTSICVNGGVSRNDFVCQMLADMTNLNVVRYTNHEKTILGATYLAGLNAGIWNSPEDLLQLRVLDKIFIPNHDKNETKILFKNMDYWQKVATRFKEWYQ